MLVFSAGFPNLFLLRRFFCTFFYFSVISAFIMPFFLNISNSWAWNPDVAYGLPKQRRMCVKRLGQGQVQFRAIGLEEDCPAGERRYVTIFAKEPRGALALVKSTTAGKFYPPLGLQWPSKQSPTRTRLWHFTCVGEEIWEILGSELHLNKYLGEMTLPTKESSCSEAEARALSHCQKRLKGDRLLENCGFEWSE